MSKGGGAARSRGVDPLWIKAPAVLLRFPALLASLATGALLLALAAASYPMFISATASNALEKQIEYTTRFGSGVGVVSEAPVIDIPGQPGVVETFRQRDELVDRTMRADNLAPPIATILGETVLVRSADNPRRSNLVRLVFRDKALEHIDMVDGRDGDGAFIAELVAGRIGVKAGDTIEVFNPETEKTAELQVDGRYKDLFNQPQTPYWMPLNQDIYPRGDSGPPPTFLFLDAEQTLRLSKELAPDEIQPGGFPTERLIEAWSAPLRTRQPITLEEARELQSFADDFERRFRTDDRFSDVFCFNCFRGIPFVTSNIRQVVLQTDRRIAPVEGPVRLVLVAGLLVALAVIAGAGVFAVATRRTETGLLFARGMNPATIAIKTCLESFIPALVGAAAGYGLAVLLVSVGGPDGEVGATAARDALIAAAIAVPVSIILLGVVASVSFARFSESASERLSTIARIPWEVALLLAAGYFYNRLRSGGALVEDRTIGVTRPSISLLIFPIFLIGGLGMLGARGFQSAIGWLRERLGKASAALYLMLHRIAGAQRLAMLLFAGAALSLGIFVHGQTIVNSLERTVDAKAYLFVGSDVQATVTVETEPPQDAAFPVTKTTRLLDAGNVAPGDRSVDLLAVDPDSIGAATYWDPQFGAESIEDVTRAVEDDGGDALRVAVANGDLSGATSFTYGGDETIPIEVVTTVETFPGTSSRLPLMIADAAAVDRLLPVLGPLENPRSSTELWGKGDTRTIRGAFGALENEPYSILTAEEVKDIPSISAVIDTFGVLNVLGLGAGFLVIVVILMYLQARQRARVVSFALSRRMGLSVGSHRWALATELAVLLLGSFVLGGILAIVAAVIVVGMIDPLASIPPDPLFIPPLGRFAIAALVLLCVAVIGGALTNRRAGRARIAEVMRVAE